MPDAAAPAFMNDREPQPRMAVTIEPSRFRAGVVFVFEAALLALVIGTAAYFGLVALDDEGGLQARLYSGWAAALLTLMALWPLLRRWLINGSWRRGRGRQEGLLEGDVGAVIWLQTVIFGLGGVTCVFTYTSFFKPEGSAEDLWLAALLMAMIFWPDVRHRILLGFWKPSPFSPQR